MTWARGYFDSLHGRIESEWKVADNATRYRFVVPENTTATLHLPVTSGAEVKTDADVVPAGDEGSTQIYELGPGTFEFAVTAAPAEPN
jgi:alpha-L-rhamnosidase